VRLSCGESGLQCGWAALRLCCGVAKLLCGLAALSLFGGFVLSAFALSSN